MINVLFIGDVVGFSGFKFLCENLNDLKEKYNTNFIVVNGENICNGKGITEREANILLDMEVNVITTGNHIWDNWVSKRLMKNNNFVIRPYNYPPGNVGRGYIVVTHPELEVDIAVMQLQGRTFMPPIDCPFRAADHILTNLKKNKTEIIIVDFHAEATSEKVSMGIYLDGKVSAVIGTHTHIQTADAQILPKGTAYITDVGMSGSFDSVLGLRKDVSLNRHIYQIAHKYEPATENNKISGAIISIDKESGRALSIDNFIFPELNRTNNQELSEQNSEHTIHQEDDLLDEN